MEFDLQSSRFVSYNLSEEESRLAVAFSDLTVAFLRTQQAQIAEQRLNLEPAVTQEGYLAFVQEEAFLKGQLAFVAFLLNAREAALQHSTEVHSTEER